MPILILNTHIHDYTILVYILYAWEKRWGRGWGGCSGERGKGQKAIYIYYTCISF